jgi:biofilm PGA synthesis N-glycosyltransferase PgaC
MVISPWYDVVELFKKKLLKEKNPEPYIPRVSIIVPAWNEEVGLIKTVETILKSTYRNTEIVVINDGSTDNSDHLMKMFIREYEKNNRGSKEKIDIVYHYKENGGKGRALNKGIELSSGEIIISIDADCVLLPDTIANFVGHFEDPNVMAAVGNVKIGNQKTLLETLQYLEFLFSFYFKKADSLLNTIYIIGGAAGAFRRSIFDTVGPYSYENITEDIDLSVRIQKAGMRIVYASDAIVYTEAATTFSGLADQRLRWKRGRFQTFFEHRRLFFSEKHRHNKLLSWLVLPLAVFGDIQLFFEVFFLAFLYVYSFVTHDFSSFLSGIIVVSSMFFVQLWDDKTTKREDMLTLYLLAPIGWLLFYVTTIVEYRALVKAIWGMTTKQKLSWQRWKRVGISKNQTDIP